MAKKKKVAKKKPAKGRIANKTASGKAAGSKTKKKPAGKKPSIPKTGSRGASVDTLLKKYENERKTQEAKLSGSIKRIDELELKATKLQEQIAKLKAQAESTQIEIDQLDSRRDAEVADVLASLGVQLSSGSAAESETRPVLTLGRSPHSEEFASTADDNDAE